MGVSVRRKEADESGKNFKAVAEDGKVVGEGNTWAEVREIAKAEMTKPAKKAKKK